MTHHEIALGCVLSPRTLPWSRGECVWCAGALPGRRLRWCGKPCIDAYQLNHEWSAARLHAVIRASFRPAEGWTVWTYCDQCGKRTSAPEVNHVDPRRGRGYDPGCWNHQTNLQVLCHACHVAETNQQRRARTARVVVGTESIWAPASRPERPVVIPVLSGDAAMRDRLASLLGGRR